MALKPPFEKLLVANRGEIAVRVIRGAHDVGIRTVAVHSEVDANLPHVRLADEAYCIGPAPSAESYLNSERILEVARQAGVDAIHPGYGFLAENAAFARACEAAGITFVGPSGDSMEKMGDKIEARRTMKAAGVPIVPGTIDPVSDPAEAKTIAAEIGYPVAVKASAGGGGKGIRIVQREDELERAMTNAQDEARAAFGDGSVFIEKYISPARHIEIQVIADKQGNVATLGERECSIQRRRQKLIEEAPSLAVSPQLRAEMEEAARNVVRSVEYVNAGTVEFLVYGEDEFAFLEMNTRLQVEHPVTEMVRGVDLVADQLRVAAGEPLGYTGDDLPINGWAMECRIIAEDPYTDYLPSTGRIPYYREPAGPGVRVESMLHAGMEVSVHYDSLLAKLVTWGVDREQCRQRMKRALREFQILGVSTSIPFHLAMLDDPNFISGAINTEYVEEVFQMPQERPSTSRLAALAAAAYFNRAGEQAPGGSQLNGGNDRGRSWGMYARGKRAPLEVGWRRNFR
ncbi:MAG: acetyl-CoA carboxylase biotin carboxylase subunit [Chloroflexi bacterium]|nr:acetyl-CoA carboxylase biotin carboxylase subunit [Chloroflexota bacterium]